MPRTAAPHYLRFARSIALVSALAGAPACATSHTRGDAPPAPRDAAVAEADAAPPTPRDAGAPDAYAGDAGHTCATCRCMGWGGDDDPGVVYCESVGLWDCCAAIGPLFPPDLPV